MKKLSIEEKAKAYDEALKVLHKYDGANIMFSQDLKEEMFPELAESEDERIRKKVIDVLKLNVRGAESQMQASRGVDRTFEVYACNKVISWLEKQSEQKPKFRVGDTIKCKYDDRQFTIKSVNLDKGTYTYTQEGCGNDIDYADEEFELAEQKPAWSEEDETTKNNISHIIRQYDKISKRENQPCYYVGDCLLWMQNIKERVVPQPKQEWSEEEIESCAREAEDNNCIILAKHIRQLKSLRPQNRWKPSEEEMDALDKALSLAKNCGEESAFDLRTLHEQLKKLRNE